MDGVEIGPEHRVPRPGNGGDGEPRAVIERTPVRRSEPVQANERVPDLFDYWSIIWTGRGLLLKFFCAALALSLAGSLLMTTKYRAKTSILPISDMNSGLGSLMAMMGDVPMLGGIAKEMGVDSPNSRLLTVLESRTLTENVIASLDLMPVLFEDDWDADAGTWKDNDDAPTLSLGVEVMQEAVMRLEEEENGAISISVLWENPQLAAAMANQYVQELGRFLNDNALTLAQRNRIFIEEQLAGSVSDLAQSEKGLLEFQKEHNLYAFDAQAMAGVEIMGNLQAELMSKDIELGVLRRFASDANPKVKLLDDQVEEIRAQLHRMTVGDGGSAGDAGIFPPMNKAPDLGLEYLRLKRDTLIEETVFRLLTQQYELAKIEEARDQVSFQVIDKAVPPEKKARPLILLNMAVAGGSSGILGLFYLFLAEHLRRLRSLREQV